RTRLIINLTDLAPYTTRVEGNNLFILVGADQAPGYAGGAPAAVSAPVMASGDDWRRSAQAAVSNPADVSSGPAIRSVDFQRGEEGEGSVIVDLSAPSLRVDVQEQVGR